MTHSAPRNPANPRWSRNARVLIRWSICLALLAILYLGSVRYSLEIHMGRIGWTTIEAGRLVIGVFIPPHPRPTALTGVRFARVRTPMVWNFKYRDAGGLHVVTTPLWAPTSLLLAWWLVRAALLLRSRRSPWLCRECGYDLRGGSAPLCPECGVPAPVLSAHRADA